jgi:hypothetical protein
MTTSDDDAHDRESTGVLPVAVASCPSRRSTYGAPARPPRLVARITVEAC